ncbi:hypothetical protein ACHAPE_008332 [Trichoderma viride]
MFKKDLQGAPKQKLKSSAQRALRQNLLATYPLLTPYIEEILPKKASLASMKLPDRNTLYVLDSVPLFYQNDGSDLLPHLKLVHRFPQAFPSIRIDRGAIRFVLSGATLMAPGLTSAGGRLPVDGAKPLEEGKEMEQSIVEDGRWSRELAKGEPVVIMAEGKEEACAVGTLAAGTDEVKAKGKGPVVEDAHYLGDAVYDTPAEFRNCPSLHLSLIYNPINAEDIGLGKGWSFNLSSYQHRRVKALLLSTGENYQVTETTSSIVVKDQNGNHYELQHYCAYRAAFYYKSPAEVGLDPFGRTATTPEIQDGSDVLLSIEYSDAPVKITRAPGTAEASALALARRGGRVIEVRLPLDGSPSWKFEYDQDAYLTKVKSPAGLEEDIVYNKKRPSAPQRRSTISPMFGSGFDWKDGEDNLYREREDYRYSSTMQVDGGATTKYTYNRFHLIVSSETSKGEAKTTQTTTYHTLAAGSASNQHNTSFQRVFRQPTKHNNSFIQPTGVKVDREYYAPAGETDHCPSDPHGFQRYIKSTTVTLVPSTYNTPTARCQVFYSQLPTAAAAPYADRFVAAKEEKTLQHCREISSVQHSYVNQPASQDHGRLTQDITRIFGQYPTTVSGTYRCFSPGRLTQATEVTSFDGSSINETASFSLLSGLALMHQDSGGAETDFVYDLTGQLMKKTFSPGTQYEATECLDYTTV